MLSQRLGLAVAAAFTLVAVGLVAPTDSMFGDAVAFASPAFGGKDKNKDDDDRRKNQGNDGDEDHNISGQVLSINREVDPPELTLASVDGETVVRLLKTDEIDVKGVEPGDYISAAGEKISELLFESTNLDVDEKFKNRSSSSSKKKK